MEYTQLPTAHTEGALELRLLMTGKRPQTGKCQVAYRKVPLHGGLGFDATLYLAKAPIPGQCAALEAAYEEEPTVRQITALATLAERMARRSGLYPAFAGGGF